MTRWTGSSTAAFRDADDELNIAHPRVGDLTISADYLGGTIVLFDGLQAACTEGMNLEIIFDDEAPGAAVAQPCNSSDLCDGCPYDPGQDEDPTKARVRLVGPSDRSDGPNSSHGSRRNVIPGLDEGSEGS